MCGIAGFVSLTGPLPAIRCKRMTEALLEEIESRGTDATGVLSVRLPISGGGLCHYITKANAKATTAMALPPFARAINVESYAFLLHTRQSTGGDPKVSQNNHPVTVGGTSLIHNGVISNNSELREEIQKRNPKLVLPEVDTASLVYLIQSAIEAGKGVLEAVESAVPQCRGFMRCAFVSRDHPTKVALFNPDSGSMFLGLTEDGVIIFASTKDAIYAASATDGPPIHGFFPRASVKSLEKKIAVIDIMEKTITIHDCPDTKPYIAVSPYPSIGSSVWKGYANDDWGAWGDVGGALSDEQLQWGNTNLESREEVQRRYPIPTAAEEIVNCSLSLFKKYICSSNRPKARIIFKAFESLQKKAALIAAPVQSLYTQRFVLTASPDSIDLIRYYYGLCPNGDIVELYDPEKKYFRNPEFIKDKFVGLVMSCLPAHPKLMHKEVL